MGMQIRDDRQMKALTGLSQAHFDHLLPVFSAIYQAAQQKPMKMGRVRNANAETWWRLARQTAHDGR